MAASVNKVILIGNLGSDPEMRYLEGGTSVARFNIATTEHFTNKSGERVEVTEWHRIELWNRLAQVAEKYLRKGNSVYIEGQIRTENWTDKEGQARTSITIRANQMQLLGGATASSEGRLQEPETSRSAPQAPPQGVPGNAAPKAADPISPALAADPSDDDILPF